MKFWGRGEPRGLQPEELAKQCSAAEGEKGNKKEEVVGSLPSGLGVSYGVPRLGRVREDQTNPNDEAHDHGEEEKKGTSPDSKKALVFK